MIITKSLLKRYGGTIICRGCGRPIEEGETATRRRVNNTIRYFHINCIYTEKKTTQKRKPRKMRAERRI